jgi:antitoxin component YwqK of YwqJK toxin-antitoxin module
MFENDTRNGLGLLWFPSGDLYQCTYKDGRRDGLELIIYKDTHETAEVEYQDGLEEGLNAKH